MNRRGLLAAAVAVALGGSDTTALAHTFEVSVTIQRPAQMSAADPTRRQANPQSSQPVEQWVPASFQLVQVWQPGMYGPQFCGSGYTDSQGRLDGVVFTCGARPPLQIQLEVLGESARGFRVGYNSPWPHEQLHTAYAWHWYSPWTIAYWGASSLADNSLPFGVFRPGGGGNLDTLDYRAAAVFELVDFVYQQWNLGNIATRSSPGPTPLFTSWIVNDNISTLGLTAPWTYWTTVHMPASSSGRYLMWSTPHELGHVLYNINHSGWDHYMGEVTGYMSNHSSCVGISSKFGAYEGFANAFWALTWSGHSSAYSTLAGCTGAGISLEDNVQEFYAHAFAGAPMERPPAALHDWTTHRIGANLYAFPSSWSLLGMVAGARMAAEDVGTMWTSSLRGMCAGSFAGAPAFCGSRRFKCMVRDKALLVPGELPDFDNPSCAPGASAIVSLTRPSLEGDALTVQFAPSDLADSYQLVITRSTGTTTTAIDVASQDVLSTLTASAMVPRCESATLSIRTSFGGVATQGPVSTGTWGCNRTSSTRIVVEPIPLTPSWY